MTRTSKKKKKNNLKLKKKCCIFYLSACLALTICDIFPKHVFAN